MQPLSIDKHMQANRAQPASGQSPQTPPQSVLIVSTESSTQPNLGSLPHTVDHTFLTTNSSSDQASPKVPSGLHVSEQHLYESVAAFALCFV